MKLSALIPLAALASTSSAADPWADFDPAYVCESTEGSPLLHHVDELIANLRGAGDTREPCAKHGPDWENKCGGTNEDYTGHGGGAVFSTCVGPGPAQALTVSFFFQF